MLESHTTFDLGILGRLYLLPGRVHTSDLPGLPLPVVGSFHRLAISPLVHDLRSSLHGLRRVEAGGQPDGGNSIKTYNTAVVY